MIVAEQINQQIRAIPTRARQAAQTALANQTVFNRISSFVGAGGSVQEWADTFVMQVDEMCRRATQLDSSGAPAWAKNPRVVAAIADYVETEARDQARNAQELLSVSGNVRGIAQQAAAAAAKVMEAAVKGALKGLQDSNPTGSVGLVAAGALVVAVAAAYVWRAFR